MAVFLVSYGYENSVIWLGYVYLWRKSRKSKPLFKILFYVDWPMRTWLVRNSGLAGKSKVPTRLLNKIQMTRHTYTQILYALRADLRGRKWIRSPFQTGNAHFVNSYYKKERNVLSLATGKKLRPLLLKCTSWVWQLEKSYVPFYIMSLQNVRSPFETEDVDFCPLTSRTVGP